MSHPPRAGERIKPSLKEKRAGLQYLYFPPFGGLQHHRWVASFNCLSFGEVRPLKTKKRRGTTPREKTIIPAPGAPLPSKNLAPARSPGLRSSARGRLGVEMHQAQLQRPAGHHAAAAGQEVQTHDGLDERALASREALARRTEISGRDGVSQSQRNGKPSQMANSLLQDCLTCCGLDVLVFKESQSACCITKNLATLSLANEGMTPKAHFLKQGITYL